MILETLASLIESLVNYFVVFIKEDLPKIILAVIIMLFAAFLARQAVKLVERALKRSKAEKGVTTLLMNLTRWAILGIGFVVALGLFVNVSSLITTLGLLTFAVTFAFQDVLKNFVSGIIILVQHPFNVGESVSLSGFEGTVVSISSRMTEIDCFDGRFVAIPNGNAIADPIINFSRSPKRRAEVPMRLPYGTEIGILRNAILPAVKEVPGYLDEPASMVTLDVMDELSIGLTVYFWVDISVLGSMLIVKDKGIEVITRALAEKGIPIPVPVQSIVLKR
jgi:small conductance mechanosensitive channel